MVNDTEESYSYGECRCCLARGNHRDILQEYYFNGVREVYYDIFSETFNLLLSKVQDLSVLICSRCVGRLRDARSFRMLVASTELHLLGTLSKQMVFVAVPTQDTIEDIKPDVTVKEEADIDITEHTYDSDFISADDLVAEAVPSPERVPGEAALVARFSSLAPLLTRAALPAVAHNFARHLEMLKQADGVVPVKNYDPVIKPEADDESYDVEYLDEEFLENHDDNGGSDEESGDDKESIYERDNQDEGESQDEDDDDDDVDEVIFKDEDIYLEEISHDEVSDEENSAPDSPAPRKRKVKEEKSDSETVTPKPKWPKKLPKEERWNTYKQYTEDDLRQALEDVMDKKMNQKQAATHYHVPRKTLSAKILAIKSEQHGTERALTPTKDELTCAGFMALLTKHRENIHSVLAYSNATPIRCYSGMGYACVFCAHQHRDPAALKRHTRTQHITENYKVKRLRSHLVKLDVTGLKCSICNTKFVALESFMRHLKSKHDKPMHFDIKNHIVPYKFDKIDLECVKCGKLFNNFKNISEHMNNIHFRNYECDKCPHGFVNKNTLMTHGSNHKTGEFPCDYCRKIFRTHLRKREHERTLHIHNSKTRKCGYCPEKFIDVAHKINHEVLVHKAERQEFSCTECKGKFTSPRLLCHHKKKQHHV